ncbi:hypothetical protein DFJ63DRAFT_310111 [Scheffersomyces coipomensis]|uniref:uncharacterized protein n=1 Tax=Scheffersomyces coipomensis TaxID=1788519 RepID=UPI00315C7340
MKLSAVISTLALALTVAAAPAAEAGPAPATPTEQKRDLLTELNLGGFLNAINNLVIKETDPLQATSTIAPNAPFTFSYPIPANLLDINLGDILSLNLFPENFGSLLEDIGL